jgi:RNA polymerase sigma factor (sigma-70 family)
MSAARATAEAGQAVAVRDSYRENLTAVVRYLRRRLGEEAAEDAAADVFVRALRHPAQDFSLPWLYGIATNVIAERRRAERRRLRAMKRVARANADRADRAAREPAVDPQLVAALRRLNATDRECLLLIAWGELTYEEVARATDVPVGTVRSRVARARRQLRDAVEPTRPGPIPTIPTENTDD